MTDRDPFMGALVRAAAAYHRPPDAPTETMWARIENHLAARVSETSEDDLLDSAKYHEPPEPPREEMWGRIDAAWTLRQSAPEGAREAGLTVLEPAFDLDAAEQGASPRERRSVALWISGVAAAALIFGIMIGRGTAPGGPRVAQAPTMTPVSGVESPRVRSELDPDLAAVDDAFAVPLESHPELLVARAASAEPPSQQDESPSASSSDARLTTRTDRRNRVARQATTAHLDRTETLFAAFRVSDDEPADLEHLASSARSLLGETRLLLALPVDRPVAERVLLEEIELVLAQIARLGPNTDAFEHDLAHEGLERLGTVTGGGRLMRQSGT